MAVSGRGQVAVDDGGEVCPGHFSRIIHVEFVDEACTGRARELTAARVDVVGREGRGGGKLQTAWGKKGRLGRIYALV